MLTDTLQSGTLELPHGLAMVNMTRMRQRRDYVLYAQLVCYIYFFSSGGGGGGGTGLSSSGLLGAVPSPTCSQGDKASKFLDREGSAKVQAGGHEKTDVPECLSELERLIDNPLSFLIVSYLRVTLYRQPHV